VLLEEMISVCCRSLWLTIANFFFIGKKDPALFLLHGNNTNTNAIAMVQIMPLTHPAMVPSSPACLCCPQHPPSHIYKTTVRLLLFLIMVHRYDSGVDTGTIAIGGRGPVASVWFVSAAVAYLY
jgi:hypothetical protein